MKFNLKSRKEWLSLAAWIAALSLSLVLVGCGGERQSDDKGVVVRNPQRSQRATRPTPPTPTPVTDTTPAPVVPEAQVVSAPEPPKEVTFEEAEAAFHEKRYTQAVELFTLYTDRKSENPWGHYMLGLSSWQAGDHDTAQKAFERSLELDPHHVKSWLNLGRVLLDMGKPEDALIKIRQAVEIDPESGVAYRLKGRVFDDIGQKPQAVESYQRAILIDNEDVWSMNNLGLILIEEGLYGQALPPLARAVELQSDNATFLNNLGMALECTGQFRAAEKVYESAVAIDGSYEKAVLNLSRIQAVREDPGLEPVDLESIARAFTDAVQSWRAAVVTEEPQSAEPSIVSSEPSEPDEPETDTDNDGDTDSPEGGQE